MADRDFIDITHGAVAAADDTGTAAAADDPARASHGLQTAPQKVTDLDAAGLEAMTTKIITAIKTVYDPEIPVDIYELGLIYKVDLEDDGLVKVEMTLTAPGCPVAGEMPEWVREAVNDIEEVTRVEVDMVFDPPWTPDRMSDEAKLQLGWM